mmetsp:Transcript_4692/g.8658  ORF Transcript_4692/g.8658 Transcript_4692/m.8658 type:complete len:243 (+) Transcript_4692:259-987(+)
MQFFASDNLACLLLIHETGHRLAYRHCFFLAITCSVYGIHVVLLHQGSVSSCDTIQPPRLDHVKAGEPNYCIRNDLHHTNPNSSIEPTKALGLGNLYRRINHAGIDFLVFLRCQTRTQEIQGIGEPGCQSPREDARYDGGIRLNDGSLCEPRTHLANYRKLDATKRHHHTQGRNIPLPKRIKSFVLNNLAKQPRRRIGSKRILSALGTHRVQLPGRLYLHPNFQHVQRRNAHARHQTCNPTC